MTEEMSLTEMQNAIAVCLDEIIKLKNENMELKKTCEEMQNSYALYLSYLSAAVDNVRYEANDPRFKEQAFFPTIIPIQTTINKIKSGASMARFGDGEFSIMANVPRPDFQRIDELLANRLKEIIAVDNDDFIIGIADNYGDLMDFNQPGIQGIRTYMTDRTRRIHRAFLCEDRIYHNAYITRPYALYRDNETSAPRKRFDDLKTIWCDRDIIFVEGFQTRMGVGNDLFDNVKSIKRIECPQKNAFDSYENIFEACLKNASSDSLFIIALGPTAGVLAYDLYKEGYQALDMGHVDLEYEWFKNGEGSRSKVSNKYNNESSSQREPIEDVTDPVFYEEIVAVIE